MHYRKISPGCLFGFSLILSALAAAVCGEVRLPAVIGDNMVLQQGGTVPVWGWAEPGEEIEVVLGNCAAVKTVSDKCGKWIVKVQAPKAGGPYEMTVRGKNTITIKNVLVGEVWVCSGQSNMEMTIDYKNRYLTGVLNAQKEIADANYPDIRMFMVEQTVSQQIQSDCKGSWQICSPQTAGVFSAAAFFFGRQLYRELNVPVGLINTSWGGTPAEAWTKHRILEADPDFEPILRRFDEAVANYPQAWKEYQQKLEEWEKASAQAQAEGKEPPREPFKPLGLGHQNSPSGLYNAMLAPLMPYGIRGVIWYQGEANAGRPCQYRKLFPAMIKNWRDDWGRGDFPFYYVQIAPFHYKDWSQPIFAAELREAQLMTLSVPNTGMVVTMDIGDVNNIHPKNKQEVGRRLALWALAKTYGRSDIVYSGPIYKSMKIEGNKIRLYFDYVGSGPVSRGGPLTHFTIAGQDKQFVEAEAKIDGNTVVVYSDKVEKPVAVRYAWANAAMPNLFNKKGLPASPFRTDDWPTEAVDRK